MLGGGFPAATVERGISLGADIIAVDGGSTDSGPHYLGTATAKTARVAVGRDLRVILAAARAAGIPVVVGSCGTSGTDAGVDWVHDIAHEAAGQEGISFRVARIYSEQDAGQLETLLDADRIRPLEPAGPLTLCTTSPLGGGVLATLDPAGFTIEPVDAAAACTPATVAAHMMYENADPFRMREPAGTVETSHASYLALDDRRVRVEGSRFEPAGQHTIKLEGAAPAGYQTIIISGIRDPAVLARLDEWCDQVIGYLHQHILPAFGLTRQDYDLQIRRYGHDAVLGAAEAGTGTPPREAGIVFMATAADQATATQLAKFANPLLLHAPLAGSEALPSYAFLGSPAEIERGQIHEFVLQHAAEVATSVEMFRTVHGRPGR